MVSAYQHLQNTCSYSDILKQADVVQDLAENWAIIILIDEVNLHPCKANMIWHTLICKQLSGDKRQVMSMMLNLYIIFF